MKTYMLPVALRRGDPVMHYVVSERSVLDSRETIYWLGTYHDFVSRGRPANPYGKDHRAGIRISITKELYDAFREESKRNRTRFKVPK